MTKKLNTGWFIDVPADKKKDTEESIVHATIARRQMRLFIQEQMKQLDQTKFEEDYTSAAWAFKQADRLGQLRAYRKLLTLVAE